MSSEEERQLRIGFAGSSLVLSDVHEGRSTRSASGTLDFVNAVLELPGVRAETRVSLADGIDVPLADVLDDICSHWREWSGIDNPKRWSTYEGGLALSFVHDGLGHVGMTVELSEGSGGWGWFLRGDVPIEVGQLEDLVKATRRFFAPR